MLRRALIMIVLFVAVFPAGAQAGITDDDVNDVAGKLYCPVCENIPLDVCGTQACADWRSEIRTQLEQGSSPQQIIDAFVARYGERVIGTPQDPMLRALSLITPWVIGGLALLFAALTFNRWRSTRLTPVAEVTPQAGGSDAEYRARLERDLLERR